MPEQVPQTSALAVAALVMGIGAWTFAPCIGGILAIILGSMARREIQANGMGGSALATWGSALGWANVLIVPALILLFAMFSAAFHLSR